MGSSGLSSGTGRAGGASSELRQDQELPGGVGLRSLHAGLGGASEAARGAGGGARVAAFFHGLGSRRLGGTEVVVISFATTKVGEYRIQVNLEKVAVQRLPAKARII